MSNKRVFNNFFWRFLERVGSQGVAFVISIVLARLLDPTVYGTVALVTVFTTILQVFVESGFGTALVQKKDADDLDFSTVFYFNIAMCLVLYAGLYFAAPYIDSFYAQNGQLTDVVRVLGLTLIISGLRAVQQAYVTKKLLFKRFFFSTIGGTVFSAVVGIYMAWRGMGVWALVGQQITNQLFNTAILWITVRWRPRLLFSFRRLKGLFSYGWKLLTSALIDTVYKDLRSLIIGKLYTADALAFYNKGQYFPKTLITNVNTSIDSVLLPVMSERQDNREYVKQATRRAIKTSIYLVAPLMIGLAAVARPMVLLLLTEKWIECVFFLQIFCFTFMLYPIHTANLNAIKAMGRSDLFLILEIVKKAIGLVLLLTTMSISVEVMAITMLASGVISSIVNAFPNKKLLNYSYFEQILDIIPSLLISLVMGGAVLALGLLPLPNLALLCIQIPVGAALYVALSVLFKNDSFFYLLNTLKSYLKRSPKEIGE